MIETSTLQFLKELKKNNDRSWMEKNRNRYEQARENFTELVKTLITGIGKFDPLIAELEPKQVMFRINRDIRFSKNKSPYKTNFAAFFCPGGKNAGTAGYYVHLEPGSCFLAGGIYMPNAPKLAAIRQEIDYNLADWKKITQQGAFKKLFPQGSDQELVLSRPPKGYDADNPALPFLQLKSFTFSYQAGDQLFTGRSAAKEILSIFKTLHPVIQFLNEADA